MILVDTSLWIEFLNNPGLVHDAEEYLDDFVTCGPVVQEVLQGFADTAVYDRFREHLLAFPLICDPTPNALFLEAASLYRAGRRRGFSIRSGTDCLIAAIAIHTGAELWHKDRDFTNIARYTSLRAVARY